MSPDYRRRRADRDLGAVVNGQVLSTATVAALSADQRAGSPVIFGGLAATMLVFWIGHAYAAAISSTVDRGRVLPIAEVLRIMVREWPVAEAAVPMLLAIGLAALGAWSRDTGVALSLAAGVVGLFGWGLVYGRRAHLSVWRALAAGLVSGALGLTIVLLKVLVLH